MNTSTPSQKPTVERGAFWRIFGNRGVEYLPRHLFLLSEDELKDVALHQAVPACVWGYTVQNSVYSIAEVEGWGVYTDEWDVFATEELAKNFLAGVDVDT